MLSGMDARQHDDVIFTISQAILDARYAPPKRRRSAWGEGFDEDLEQARRVAAVIVEAFTTQRLPDLPQATGATSQHAQGPVEAWHPNGMIQLPREGKLLLYSDSIHNRLRIVSGSSYKRSR
jgi:hypothetical protein